MNEFKLTRRAADPEKQALFESCWLAVREYAGACHAHGIAEGCNAISAIGPGHAPKELRDNATATYFKAKQLLLQISLLSPGEWQTNVEEES